MISSLPEIEKRIENKDNKSEFVKSYDEDNLYPQNMKDISNASGTTKSCIRLYSKFIRGKGFKDVGFYKAKINDSGLTTDQLLRGVTEYFGVTPGYAIHVNYNALLKIVNVKHVPFEYCRLGIGEKAGKIAVYDNWDCLKGKFDRTKIEYIDQFTTDPVLTTSQINGDIESYKGQILWRSTAGKDYPLAYFDAVVEDVISDSSIKKYRLRNIRKGFNASTVIEYGYEFEDEEERKREVENWGTFIGPDSPDVIVINNKNGNTEEKSIKISKLDVTNNDKMYEVTNRTVKDSIIQAFNQPPILLGISANGVFNANEIEDSYKFYNSVTSDERIMIEEDFKMIFDNFHYAINSTGDYSIDPLTFNVVETEKPALINTLQIGGTVALKEIIVDTTLTPEQKVNFIRKVFGVSIEVAQGMVLGTPLPE